jgi:monoamine oxidase
MRAFLHLLFRSLRHHKDRVTIQYTLTIDQLCKSIMVTPMPAAMSTPKLLDVLIVGGGLSGLIIGQGVQRMHADWRLLEARPSLGGRLANDDVFNQIDLGGAWIWPHQQPYMRDLAKSLGIQTFSQPDDSSSTRIEGGAVQFVHKIAEELPNDLLQLNSPVTSCKLETTADSEKVVRVETAGNETFLARKVVFAVPPKLLSKHVTFDPPLSKKKQAALNASQTWMAGVTKVALVYPSRFWDTRSSNMGLGGQGPAFQVYDSSTRDKNVSALTFFALVPTTDSSATDELIAEQVAEQMAEVWNRLGRPLYAKQATSYTSHHVYRWPAEAYISEDENPVRINPHPSPVRALSEPEWDGALQFAGSETDLSSPGVMEGAVGAAKRILKSLEGFLSTKAQQCSSDATD